MICMKPTIFFHPTDTFRLHSTTATHREAQTNQ
jgi:hypothetical protein